MSRIIPTIIASIIIHIFIGVACIVLAIMHFVKQDTLILPVHVIVFIERYSFFFIDSRYNRNISLTVFNVFIDGNKNQ